jgi:hypothetical protein
MAFRRIALITLLSVFATSIFAQTSPTAAPATSIIRIDPRFDELVPKDTELELVAEDIIWAEGPVWDKQGAGWPTLSKPTGASVKAAYFTTLPRFPKLCPAHPIA